jgi:hypothetical protein
MSLRYPKPPQTVVDSLRRVLQPVQDLNEAAPRRSHMQSIDLVEEPHIESAVASYMMDARDVLEGKDVRQARLIGWRFLWRNSAGELLASNISVSSSEGTVTGKPSVNLAGSFVLPSEQVLAKLGGGREAVASADYEVRMLRFPSLSLYCFWLVAPYGGDGDLLVPIPPVPSRIDPERVYGAAELLSLLRPRAEKVLNSNSRTNR